MTDPYQRLLPMPELFMPAAVEKSLAALRLFAPKDGSPYWGAFSGGKDSVVIKALAEEAGVPVKWHYNVTTIDPPELLSFIKENHSDVEWVKPKHGGFFRSDASAGVPHPAPEVVLRGIQRESRAQRCGHAVRGARGRVQAASQDVEVSHLPHTYARLRDQPDPLLDRCSCV